MCVALCSVQYKYSGNIARLTHLSPGMAGFAGHPRRKEGILEGHPEGNPALQTSHQSADCVSPVYYTPKCRRMGTGTLSQGRRYYGIIWQQQMIEAMRRNTCTASLEQ